MNYDRTVFVSSALMFCLDNSVAHASSVSERALGNLEDYATLTRINPIPPLKVNVHLQSNYAYNTVQWFNSTRITAHANGPGRKRSPTSFASMSSRILNDSQTGVAELDTMPKSRFATDSFYYQCAVSHKSDSFRGSLVAVGGGSSSHLYCLCQPTICLGYDLI
ncbi:hypothetical protein EV361DRAFT_85596 [Lentinula raphanica]|nr:hypothetical protein EV361DRAFT_85596 [Lentinula raphanica]